MNQDCGMIRKEEYWNMLRSFSKLKGYEGWLLAQMNWHVTVLSGKEAKQQDTSNAESRCRTKEHDIEAIEKEKTAQINWQIQEKKKKTFAKITLSGVDDSYQHEITVLLVKPQKDRSIHVTGQSKADDPVLSKEQKKSEHPETEHRKSPLPYDLVMDHSIYGKKQMISFTSRQIEEYLDQTKDYNPIHKGENAIVPGFLILQKLLFELHVTDMLKENKSTGTSMDHSHPDKEKETEEGNRERFNEKLLKTSDKKKDFMIEMTWKGILYCNEECTLGWSDAYTLCGKAGQKIIWLCKVK